MSAPRPGDPLKPGTLQPSAPNTNASGEAAPTSQTMDSGATQNTLPVELPASGLSPSMLTAAGLPPEMADHPRYKILRLLGQGGMGAVFLAQHRKMERLVALKVIHAHWLDNPRTIERFQQEVKAASQLSHPNIVTAFDADAAGADGEIHFLVMEYVEGESLADYAERCRPLPIAEACEYVRQAALGLQAAHERGLVHRDIKPQNLMRSPQGQVKVLDFGLARLNEPEGSAPARPLTAEGTIMGTADYMAPEQAGEARHVDIRADIYSLGCTLYELLTGEVPYPGGTAMEKVTRHSRDTAAPVRKLRREIPPGLAAVVSKMMARRPQDRYHAPAEVAAALAPFAAGKTETGNSGRMLAGVAVAAALAVAAFIGFRSFAPAEPSMTPATQTKQLAAALPENPPVTPPAKAVPPKPRPGEFHEIHQAPQAALEKWAAAQQAEGYLPTYISLHYDGGEPQFNAISVPNPDQTKFRVRFADDGMEKYRGEMLAEGLRLRVMCPFTGGGSGRTSVSLWTSNDQGAWFARAARELIPGKMEEKRASAMRPLSLNGADDVRAPTTSVVMVPSGGLGWNAEVDLPGNELPKFIATTREQKRRIDWLTMHGRRPPRGYAVIAIDNVKQIDWDVQIDVPDSDLSRTFGERKEQGFVLTSLASYGAKNPRFTLLWQRAPQP